jgi:hypothetical protein
VRALLQCDEYQFADLQSGVMILPRRSSPCRSAQCASRPAPDGIFRSRRARSTIMLVEKRVCLGVQGAKPPPVFPILGPPSAPSWRREMLTDKRKTVEQMAAKRKRAGRILPAYAAFLRSLFGAGDWVVTISFRDRHQDSICHYPAGEPKKLLAWEPFLREFSYSALEPDPRLTNWVPDSRFRQKPGPPVRDAALRELLHWLLELGWEAAGHPRQEMFDRLADGLEGKARRSFAKYLCRRCLCCELYNDPVTHSFFYKVEAAATKQIGWVIAEEYGKVSGRWHLHLLIRGVEHLRRRKWWRRAFVRFGRTRIEPLHG